MLRKTNYIHVALDQHDLAILRSAPSGFLQAIDLLTLLKDQALR